MPAEKHKRRSSSRSSGSSSGSSSKKRSFGKRLSKQIGKLTEAIEKGFKVVAEAANGIMDMILSVLFPKNLRKKVDKIGKSKKAKKVSKKVGKQVGKLTDNVEKSFKKGASGFFEVFGFLFAIIVPKFIRDRVSKVWKAIGSRFSKFFKRLNKGLSAWAEKYLPPWLLQLIKRTSQRIKTGRKNFSKFSNAWFKSRDFISLAWSTPAVLMALPLGAILALSSAQAIGDKQKYYSRQASKYDQDKLYGYGQLCRKRLTQLGYMQMESAEYRSALERADAGDYAEAYEIMKSIAPLSPEFMAKLDLNDENPAESEGVPFPDSLDEDASSEGESSDSEITLASGEANDDNGVANVGGLGISTSVTTIANEVIATSLPPSMTPTSKPNGTSDEAGDSEADATQSDELAEAINEAEFYEENFKPAHIWIGFNLVNGNIKEKTDRRKWLLVREHARVANLIHIDLQGDTLTDKDRSEFYKDRLDRPTFADQGAAVLTIACDQHEEDTSIMLRMIDLADDYDPYKAHVMRHFHRLRNYSRAIYFAKQFEDALQYDRDKALKDQARPPSESELVSLIEAYSIMNLKTPSGASLAETVAEQGAAYYGDDELLQKMRALVLRKKMYKLSPYDADYLDSLIEIHQIDPENTEIASSLARRLRDGSQAIRIEDLIEKGQAGVALLLELGDLATAIDNDYNRALKLYDEALKVDKNSSRAYNNKAYVLKEMSKESAGAEKEGQIDDALKFANEAIQLDRDNDVEPDATYFETRGQIYLERREWQNAVKDLTRALNGILSLLDQQSAHRGLVEAYTELGQPDLAKYHQDVLESLQRDDVRTRVRF